MKVLVVDDSADNRYFFESLLKGSGYMVTGASNGAEALEALNSGSFDLVISDIMMPVMDGFRLLQECKNDLKLENIPFIFVTGAYVDQEDEELALKLGVKAFLRKPVEPADLIKSIDAAVSSQPAPARRGRKPKAKTAEDAGKLLEERLTAKLAKKMDELESEAADRKDAEAALQESEEQYHLLFETMSQGVVYQDAGGRVLSANPAALKILGLTDDQIKGRTSYDPRWRSIHEDGTDYPGKEHPSMIALASGQHVRNARMGIYNPAEQRYRWVSVDAVPLIKPGEDKPYRVYTTLTDITESLFAHKAIMESESRLHAILENTSDAIFSIDRDFRLITANSIAKKRFKESTGHDLVEGIDMLSALAPDRRLYWKNIADSAMKGEHAIFTMHYAMPGGAYDVEFSANPIVSASGYVTGFSFFGKDITERTKASENLARNSRLFQMLFLCNEAMVHANKEPELLQNICRVLVETGGYRMAWVGYALQDENKTIKPVAYYGTDDNYLSSVNVSWAENGRGSGPAGKAVRTGKTVVCQDISKDPDYERWYEEAARQGYAGKVSFPLKDVDTVFGVLNIYSSQADFFTTDELELLQQLSEDMAYGISSLWAGRERQAAEESLKESEERYRFIADHTGDVIWLLDKELHYTYTSPSITRQRGFTPEEMKAMEVNQVVTPESVDKLAKLLETALVPALQGENTQMKTFVTDLEVYCKDGSTLWTETSVTLLLDSEGKFDGVMGISRDITARRRAEAALRESEEKYRTILDEMNEAYYEIDKKGNYTYFNDTLCRLLGYTREEMTGLNYKAYTPPEARQRAVQVFSGVFNTGVPARNIPMVNIRKDGAVLYIENTVFPIRDSSRAITGLRGLGHDITERRKSEEELRKRALFLDSAYDSIIAFKENGDIIYANETAAQSRGYSVEEMLTMNIRQFVPAENVPLFEERLKASGRLGELSFEPIHVARDGTVLELEARLRSITFEGTKLHIAVYRDITARKKMQAELVDSEARYRGLIETAGAAVAVIDLSGNLTYVNDLTCETLGYPREELLGRHFADLVHPDDQAKLMRFFEEGVRTSPPVRKGLTIEFRVLHKDGNIVWFYTNPTRMISGGKTTGFSAIMPDITKLKQAEAALQESEQRYRSLFENNPVAVYMQDINGRFISVNDATSRVTGYSREEILALSPDMVIIPEDLEDGRRRFIKAMRGEPQTYEQTIVGKNGNRIQLNVTNTAVKVNDKIVGVYSVSEDITERKKAEADLKSALEMINTTLEGTIEAIAVMSELRDPYTAGHQRMVTVLAVAIAAEIGLTEEQIQALRVAGLLHDVGKVYVPSEILSKPGRLSDLEMNLAKAHAEAGYDIVKTIKFPWPVAQIIRQHHERMDGSGYPQGLKGNEIMLEARILAVADVVEAMMAHRPYRPALGMEKALEEISSKRGVLYHEPAVDACITLFREKDFNFKA